MHALYGYAVGPGSYVQMAVYVDREEALGEARTIWESVRERGEDSQGKCP